MITKKEFPYATEIWVDGENNPTAMWKIFDEYDERTFTKYRVVVICPTDSAFFAKHDFKDRAVMISCCSSVKNSGLYALIRSLTADLMESKKNHKRYIVYTSEEFRPVIEDIIISDFKNEFEIECRV